MGTNRDPEKLKEMWTSWHDNVGAPMRQRLRAAGRDRQRRREGTGLSPMSARCGARATTCRPTNSRALMDRLWGEVKPLYDQLHCYVARQAERAIRRRGAAGDRPDPRRPARQHVGAGMGRHLRHRRARRAPATSATTLTTLLAAQGYDPIKMVKTGEGFYTSLGLPPLPATFWERSMFDEAARSRSGLPRLRVGHRQPATICASRCASRSTPTTS